MDFNETMKQFASRVENLKNNIATEEATKMSLIVPFFQLLGYDVFNPTEFCPEYTADVGIKKGEKVDYAIIENGQPIILIECKSCSDTLDKHSSQLFRYFGTTSAKFGILTNGLIYRFYTDLEESNKMDLSPFLEINILALKDSQLIELKKFCKDSFDTEKIFSTAEELKYTTLIRGKLTGELENPSEAFVRMMLADIYDGQKNQKIIDKFTPIVKRSFSSLITETVNQKISSALTKEEEIPTSSEAATIELEQEEISKVVTTQEEIEAFYIIRGILAGTTPVESIAHRDAESYFGILYKDNNRKPICRLNLEKKSKYIHIPNENKKFTKLQLTSLNDLYLYKDQLIEVVLRYMSE